MGTRLITLVALLVLVGALGACSVPASSPIPSATATAPATSPSARSGKPVVATGVSVPSIGAQSSLIVTGRDGDAPAAPPVSEPGQASFYSEQAVPGNVGVALVLGHVNGQGRKGIFYRLKEVRVGDPVEIARSDGTTMHFVVYDRLQVAKTAFPWDRVLAPSTSGPELRLITCTGTLNTKIHSYSDNLVVFAKKV